MGLLCALRDKAASIQNIAARPRGTETGEQILLDVPALAEGKAFYKVIAAEHSPDHALLAYAVDEQGSEIHTIYIKDLASGAVLPGPVCNGAGNFSWSPDSAYLFWTFRDDNGRPAKIYRRPARGSEADDVMIYDEPDDGMFISTGVTESGAFILINSSNHNQSEFFVIPASTPTAAPRSFHPRQPEVLYTPTHWNGHWYILTNADGAVDFKIMQCAESANRQSALAGFYCA